MAYIPTPDPGFYYACGLQADDLMRTAMRSEKELAMAGQDRAIPTSVASALSKEIKDFIDESAPLMVLMSSPGIKKVCL